MTSCGRAEATGHRPYSGDATMKAKLDPDVADMVRLSLYRRREKFIKKMTDAHKANDPAGAAAVVDGINEAADVVYKLGRKGAKAAQTVASYHGPG